MKLFHFVIKNHGTLHNIQKLNIFHKTFCLFHLKVFLVIVCQPGKCLGNEKRTLGLFSPHFGKILSCRGISQALSKDKPTGLCALRVSLGLAIRNTQTAWWPKLHAIILSEWEQLLGYKLSPKLSPAPVTTRVGRVGYLISSAFGFFRNC